VPEPADAGDHVAEVAGGRASSTSSASSAKRAWVAGATRRLLVGDDGEACPRPGRVTAPPCPARAGGWQAGRVGRGVPWRLGPGGRPSRLAATRPGYPHSGFGGGSPVASPLERRRRGRPRPSCRSPGAAAFADAGRIAVFHALVLKLTKPGDRAEVARRTASRGPPSKALSSSPVVQIPPRKAIASSRSAGSMAAGVRTTATRRGGARRTDPIQRHQIDRHPPAELAHQQANRLPHRRRRALDHQAEPGPAAPRR
jgi:hypothetical protein